MLKRSLLLVVLILVGAIIWLSRPQSINESSQTAQRPQIRTTAQPPSDAPQGEAPELADISESPRHAVGEIERHQQARAPLVELEKAVAQQQKKVEERRKLLATISRTKGIIYRGNDSKFEDSDQNSETPETDDNPQLINQLGTLLRNPDDQLLSIAAGLDLPNNSIKNLYPEFLEAKRNLESLKAAGSGSETSSLNALSSRVDAIKSQLDAELAGFRKTMAANLQTSQEEAARRASDASAYIDAKRDFETDQQLLDALNVELAAEKERLKNSDR